MLNFEESSHPIFRATSALERGELRSKDGWKKSIHFNGSAANIELILRTVISVNQIYWSSRRFMQRIIQRFRGLQWKYLILYFDAGLKIVEKGQLILHNTWWRRRIRWNEESMSRVHVTSKWRSIPSERVDPWKHKDRPLDVKVYLHQERYGTEIQVESLFRKQLLGVGLWMELTNT